MMIGFSSGTASDMANDSTRKRAEGGSRDYTGNGKGPQGGADEGKRNRGGTLVVRGLRYMLGGRARVAKAQRCGIAR